jgi:hypothetical protein
MDPRVALLKEFYAGLPRDRIKLETYEHGFDYLGRLLQNGVTLEYGELTLTGLLHKYKLANVSEEAFDAFLLGHVEKRWNVCQYFDDRANRVFCFNLDNNHKTNNTELIPEMALAVQAMRETLVGVGCEPLIVASGRGYHIWCRMEQPIENQRLYNFMLRVAVLAMARIHGEGLDHSKVKINVYPDPRTRDTVSLRLFGSDHAKNKVFSQVLGPEGLLEDDGSWVAFERHLTQGTLTGAEFDAACEAVVSLTVAGSITPSV